MMLEGENGRKIKNKIKLFRYTHEDIEVKLAGELANVLVLKKDDKMHAYSLKEATEEFMKLPPVSEYPYRNQPWSLPWCSYAHSPPIKCLSVAEFQILLQHPGVFFEVAEFIHTHELFTKKLIRQGKWEEVWKRIFENPQEAMSLLQKLRKKLIRSRPIKLVSLEALRDRVHAEIRSWIDEYREIQTWRDSKYYLRRRYAPERIVDIKEILGSLLWIAEHLETVLEAAKEHFEKHPYSTRFSAYLGSYPSPGFYRDRYFLELTRDGKVEVVIHKHKRIYYCFPAHKVSDDDIAVCACVYS